MHSFSHSTNTSWKPTVLDAGTTVQATHCHIVQRRMVEDTITSRPMSKYNLQGAEKEANPVERENDGVEMQDTFLLQTAGRKFRWI